MTEDTGASVAIRTSETDHMLAVHLLGLFTLFIGPAFAWSAWRGESRASATCRNVLNFQLTMLLGYVPFVIYAARPASASPTWFFLLAFLLALATGAVRMAFAIVGSIKGYRGIVYQYPMTIPWIGRPKESN